VHRVCADVRPQLARGAAGRELQGQQPPAVIRVPPPVAVAPRIDPLVGSRATPVVQPSAGRKPGPASSRGFSCTTLVFVTVGVASREATA